MSLFSKEILIKYVSQCCGVDIYEENEVIHCSRCRGSCRTVLQGEEMKPIRGAIHCQSCAEKLSGRMPEGLALTYPASHNEDKGTCWGCGKTVKLQKAYIITSTSLDKGRMKDE